MASNSTPKTFLIFGESNKSKKNGFVRFHSFQNSDGLIDYEMTLVQKKSDASKFLNFDNVKKLAIEYSEKYNLENMKITDYTTGKVYNVKETKSKTEEK